MKQNLHKTYKCTAALMGASARIVMAALIVCGLLYTALVLAFAQVVTPRTADGSLVYNEQRQIIGSSLLAQGFSKPQYFQPRPSAVGYDASASGGSNLSPTNPIIRSRAEKIIATLPSPLHTRIPDCTGIPPDIVTASGSGLDPHITLEAAKFQAKRIASERHLNLETVLHLMEKNAAKPGYFLNSKPVVNVLEINLELDKIEKATKAGISNPRLLK